MAVINYAKAFDIVILALPAHFDVAVFQPMKTNHQRVLHQAIRDGDLSFTRADFVRKLNVYISLHLSY